LCAIWSTKIDSILSVGFSANHLGIKNWVLDREKAARAITQLENLKIAVLGGDVFEIEGGKIYQTYDSWCCDQKDDENEQNFTKRSILEAKEYILNYPKGTLGFAIVPKT